MAGAVNGWVGWVCWLGASALMTAYVLWSATGRIGWLRPGALMRLLRGHLGVCGTLRVGVFLAAGLWWGAAAGLLPSDVARIVLAVGLGGAVVVGLANAGRRAALSPFAAVLLGAVLGLGVAGLLSLSRVGVRLALGEAP